LSETLNSGEDWKDSTGKNLSISSWNG